MSSEGVTQNVDANTDINYISYNDQTQYQVYHMLFRVIGQKGTTFTIMRDVIQITII